MQGRRGISQLISICICLMIVPGVLLWGGCTMSVEGQKAMPDTLLRDHASSAAYYRQEAANARRVANDHWAMLLIYRGKGKNAQAGSRSEESSVAMIKHCERVVESFREAATSLEALAREHDKEVGTGFPAIFLNRAGGQ